MRGDVTVTVQGGATLVQQRSDKAVVNWASFGLAAGETFQLQQPGARSALLSRVTGHEASRIDGHVQANGRFFLLNPNGVIVGKQGRLDVGGLMLSTLAMSDDDFMAGRHALSATGRGGASVVNEGVIRVADGGAAVLAAPVVEQRGLIKVKLGKVALAGAETLLVDFDGDQLISYAIDPATAKDLDLHRRVDHSGQIENEGGHVELSTADLQRVMNSVINLTGTVSVDAVERQGGTIVLKAGGQGQINFNGRVTAQGQQGGTVHAQAKGIDLGPQAQVLASGQQGGGQVLMDARMADAPDMALQKLVVARGAFVDVSAKQSGDAGQALFYANALTQFDGQVLAKGGATGGDGGFVEVSARERLAYDGDVDASAVSGRAGQLLLDPAKLRIVNNAAEAEAGESALSVVTLNRNLRRGTNVMVQADDRLVVAAVVDGRSATDQAPTGTLTLEATRGDLNVLNHVLAGNVFLKAGGQINLAADKLVLSAGALNMQAGGPVNLAGALVGAQIDINALGTFALLDNAFMDARQGGVNVRASQISTAAGLVQAAGLVSMQSQGGLTVGQGGVRSTQTGGVSLVAAQGDIQLNGSVGVRTGEFTVSSLNGRIDQAWAPAEGQAASQGVTLSGGLYEKAGQPGQWANGDANSGVTATFTAKGDISLGAMEGFSHVALASTQGNVILNLALGGSETGFGPVPGAPAAGLPLIGSMSIRGVGAELNGLNLLGTQAGAGLDVDVSGNLISNLAIGVTWGDIKLKAGEDFYLGNNIFSRGKDEMLEGGGFKRQVYGIDIKAKNLVLFNNLSSESDFAVLADDLKVAKITISNSPLNYLGGMLPEIYFSSDDVVVGVFSGLGALAVGLDDDHGLSILGLGRPPVGLLSSQGILLKLSTQGFAVDAETGVVSSFEVLGSLLSNYYSNNEDLGSYQLILDEVKRSLGSAKGLSVSGFGVDYTSRWGDDLSEFKSQTLVISQAAAACTSCYGYSVEYKDDLYGRVYLKGADGLMRGVFYDALISHYSTESGLAIRTDTSGNPPVGGTIFGGVLGGDQAQSSSYSGLKYSAVGSVFGSASVMNVFGGGDDVFNDSSVINRGVDVAYGSAYSDELFFGNGAWLASRPAFNLGLGGVMGSAPLLPLDSEALHAASCDAVDGCNDR
ncbi:filamentous hemagglutinin N-terminal domain-containing protein [Aquabacterium lacunae]|nr:filamentous hemagglutinin N-terminal domain-containing protein [Aquabacterium lacunae]